LASLFGVSAVGYKRSSEALISKITHKKETKSTTKVTTKVTNKGTFVLFALGTTRKSFLSLGKQAFGVPS